MIRFSVNNGLLVPELPEDVTADEKYVAEKIAGNLNGVSTGTANYRELLKNLNETFAKENIPYSEYVDDQTVSEIENFYQTARNIKPWDSKKQGVSLENVDLMFYAGLVPEKVQAYANASKSITFGGKQVQDVDVTKQYPDLNSYLHADYSFVGAPSGLPGKKRELSTYTETLRTPTDRERQILRETLLGKTESRPESLAEMATQNLVDTQGERIFGALSADVLKQTLDEYAKARKQEQVQGILQGMGLPNINSLKEDVKSSILGDIGAGGFLSLDDKSKTGKGLSAQLDKSLGIGSSVAYNWQKWFDDTLAKRYENMQSIQDPTDAQKTYTLEKQFVNSFINDYLKPRFDTSKSINEFVSYMDVKQDEQNVLQTQSVSSALKDFANRQSEMYINSLGNQSITKNFDPKFYWNPELITGTDNQSKQNLYNEQKTAVETAWNSRQTDAKVAEGKTWKQLAYEYGLNIENKDDFAKLHYQVLGKNKGYDPVADTYSRQDLAYFIQNDLAKALSQQKEAIGNPVFAKFVTAQSKAGELVDKLNVKQLSPELQKRLTDMGLNASTDPATEIKQALTDIFSTDPALEMREKIKALNEENIKPTQEELGYGYIQRDTDQTIESSPGQDALYNIFKKAGYGGNEKDFYTEFFPDLDPAKTSFSTKELKSSSSKTGLTGLMGFSMPDLSDPFAAIGSLGSMMDSSDEEPTYNTTSKKSTYFNYFQDEEDEGAPSYFNMGTKGSFKSLFG